MFRSQKQDNIMIKNMQSFDSRMSDPDGSLVGIDAKIPGGKFDSSGTTGSQ